MSEENGLDEKGFVGMNPEEKRLQKEGMHQYFQIDRVFMKMDNQDLAMFSFFFNMCMDEGSSKQKCEKEALGQATQFVLSKNWYKIRKGIKENCKTNGNQKELKQGEVRTDPDRPKTPRKASKYRTFVTECMNRPENKAQMIGKKPGEAGGASYVMSKICAPEWQKIKGKT